jgi:Ran-binding protein 9/10
LNSLPGWESDSWGYYGDDGTICHDYQFERYGPTFSTGDVIGCCIDFQKRLVFYTINGQLLDAAFRNISFDDFCKSGNSDVYPTIGLSSSGEHVHVNFGKNPFVFDILEYVQAS